MITSSSLRLDDLKIEVTYKCPLACVHCSSDSLPASTTEIMKDKCLELIIEAASMGVKKITFSGGEPLLWVGIEEAIELAHNNNMSVTIYSSGNIPNANSIFNCLKSIGVSKLIFSIYSANNTLHNNITRRNNSHETTINSIKEATSLNIDTELHFVALARNYREIGDVISLGKKIGVFAFSILRFVPQGRGALLTSDMMDRIQYVELKRIIEEVRKDSTIKVRTGSPFNFLFLNDPPVCLSGQDRLIISPDLRIYPCDAFKSIMAEDIVGTNEYSSLESYSLKDCWEKSPYLNAIRGHLSTEYANECKGCGHLNKCNSGCLAQKTLKYGKLNKSADPNCIK